MSQLAHYSAAAVDRPGHDILLRYLLQDDPQQSHEVNTLIDNQLSDAEPGYINLATILEIVLVLRSVFQRTPLEIAVLIEGLLAVDNLLFQNEQQVFEAAYALKRRMAEFEDALIGSLNKWAGCSYTVTFDRRAAKLPDFRGL